MVKQLLRPKELSVKPNTPETAKVFKFWLKTVEDFISGLDEARAADQPAINRKRIVISCLLALCRRLPKLLRKCRYSSSNLC